MNTQRVLNKCELKEYDTIGCGISEVVFKKIVLPVGVAINDIFVFRLLRRTLKQQQSNVDNEYLSGDDKQPPEVSLISQKIEN